VPAEQSRTCLREDRAVPTADSLARFAGVLADRSRAAICLALLDGRAWTAGELARHAGVTRSTASEHLTLLVAAGLLAEERQGRHRYLRLADDQTAQLVEDLAAATGVPDRPSSLRTVRASRQLAVARTCYDHLAGALGVALFDALVDRALVGVRDGLVLTPAGRTWFVDLAGPDVLHQAGRRPLLRTCLDWTERRSHLGGVLGAALHAQLLHRAWLTRGAEHRAVTVTTEGGRALAELLGLDVHALGRQPVGHRGG
jgi:DNA-binding transcriptional ArsR family regulator